MTLKHRTQIDTLPSYHQGKPAPNVPGVRSYKLSSNENPFEPLDSVTEALVPALQRINRYPDMRGSAVVERLAQEINVATANIQLGCGSTEIITQLVDFVAGTGDEVVYPWRSFEAYPIIVTGAGATSVQVPLTDEGTHDIDAMIAAVTDRTRLIIVNNPNNPTSTSVTDKQARKLLDAVPSDVVVLFDEAYFQFNMDPDTSVAMDLFREYPNVVVAHTFSKAYGLAGLRIGYAVGPEEIIEGMSKVALPFGVSDIAQTAAMASLDAYDELSERVRVLVSERSRMMAALEAQGWHIPVPQANFFWIPFGEKTAQAAQRFMKAGLSVRVFEPEGIRISMGEPVANDTVISVCAGLAKEGFLV